MDSIALLSSQVKQAHQVVSGTISDLTADQAAWKPGGNANSIAPLLIHLVAAEDLFLKMMTGQQPLAMSSFAGKTGASEPHPMGNYGEWAARVTVDLPAFHEYAKATFASTEEYVAGLKPEDLDREIDLTAQGMSKMTLGAFITMTSVVHPSNHIGEISCMKGMQGATGYGF